MINKIYNKLFGIRKLTKTKLYKNWVEQGRTLPPPHLIKQYVIEKIQKEVNYKFFIETGTYYGEMIDSQLNNFNEIISIELGEELYSLAVEKFKNIKNVTLYKGDSGNVLIDLILTIDKPAIFWLDGHYSEGVTAKGHKDCPIFEELKAIFNGKKLSHILLIDDARLFLGENDYPTIPDLEAFVKLNRPYSNIILEDDMIKIFLN